MEPSFDLLAHVPVRLRERVLQVIAIASPIAEELLGARFAARCIDMARELGEVRDSPLAAGPPRTWAAAILQAVSWVNLATDPSHVPHVTLGMLSERTGVGRNAIQSHFVQLRELFALERRDPYWTVDDDAVASGDAGAHARLHDDDFPLDADDEALLEALEAELRAAPTGALAALQATLAELAQLPADAREVTIDAALDQAAARYNAQPQPELGGLTPLQASALVDRIWHPQASPLRIDDGATLEELAGATLLHDARLLLALVEEAGTVKATPKGNLPRAVVGEFMARCSLENRVAGEVDLDWSDLPVRNEEDCFALHRVRLVLQTAGLLKRRHGTITLTRRGTSLVPEEQAGVLHATLFRTLFQRMNLAYFDRLGPVPGLQFTIGYVLHRFAALNDSWRSAPALVPLLVLPAVLDEVPPLPYVDAPALALELRVLHWLTRLGLAEVAPEPPGREALLAVRRYRRATLFDRILHFTLPGAPQLVR